MTQSNGTIRMGIDIGGTFTDFVLVDEHTGALTLEKTLSTPADLWQGIQAGLGHYRDYLILEHDAFLTMVQERTKCPPWGLAGGKAGAINALIVNPDTPEAESIKKVNHKPVKAGSRISVRTGGGGGYGNPFERDPELVRLDVVRGYVSRGAARQGYGVVLQPDMLAIDVEDTQRLRAAIIS